MAFEREYWLPGRHVVGGRPEYQRPPPLWWSIWQGRTLEIVLFVLLLAGAGALYAARDQLVRRANRKDKRWVSWPKYVLGAASLGYAGFYLKEDRQSVVEGKSVSVRVDIGGRRTHK